MMYIWASTVITGFEYLKVFRIVPSCEATFKINVWQCILLHSFGNTKRKISCIHTRIIFVLYFIVFMRLLTTHSPLLNGHWRHCLWFFLGHRGSLVLIWYDVLGLRLSLRWDFSLWQSVGIRLIGVDCIFDLYPSRGLWVNLCFCWWRRLEVWLGFGISLRWGLWGTVRRDLEVRRNRLQLGFRRSARRTGLQIC